MYLTDNPTPITDNDILLSCWGSYFCDYNMKNNNRNHSIS